MSPDPTPSPPPSEGGSADGSEPVDPLDAVAGVSAAARAEEGVDPLDEATRRRLQRRGLDGVTAWTAGRDGFALRHDGAVDLAVVPAARRTGLGARLAAQAVAEAGPLTAWSHGDHPAAAVLAQRLGFDRARELWVMRRSSAEPLPDLVVPEGISIRGYDAGRGDADELLRVNAAAFAHHPEQGSMDADDLAARMSEPWFDPADLLVAEEAQPDGTATGLVGFHWTKRHDASLGEVYVVGVDPGAQGRGLGRVLTLAGLHHLVRPPSGQGVSEVLLYVESDNAPAVRIYTQLGFAHTQRDTHVQYRRV